MFGNKRYRTLNYELRKTFGEKVMKLSLDGGFTCPNRDGTVGTEGCIFCSEEGSGEFTEDSEFSITEQMIRQKKILSSKWDTNYVIPYFQSFTSTYDTSEKLKEKYEEALNFKGAVGLAIATRPDCLENDKIELLSNLNKKTYLWIELGLQTIHKKSANFIRRGYPLEIFEETLDKLNKNKIKTVVHLIIGLPGETREDILNTVKYISGKNIWGVKFHLMHVLKNTDLEKYYQKTNFHLLEKEEYINIICDALELIPEEMVVHRVTGDGRKSDLIGPKWSLDKLRVLSGIDMEMKRRNSYQGKN
jgi:hypothetical protein